MGATFHSEKAAMQSTMSQPTPGIRVSNASGPESPALVKMRQNRKMMNAVIARPKRRNIGIIARTMWVICCCCCCGSMGASGDGANVPEIWVGSHKYLWSDRMAETAH